MGILEVNLITTNKNDLNFSSDFLKNFFLKPKVHFQVQK